MLLVIFQRVHLCCADVGMVEVTVGMDCSITEESNLMPREKSYVKPDRLHISTVCCAS